MALGLAALRAGVRTVEVVSIAAEDIIVTSTVAVTDLIEAGALAVCQALHGIRSDVAWCYSWGLLGIKIVVVLEVTLQLRTCMCRRMLTDGEASVSGRTVQSGSGSSRLPFAQATKQALLCSCSGLTYADIGFQLRHNNRAEQLVGLVRRSDDAGGYAVFEVPSQTGATKYQVVVALLGPTPACLTTAVRSCNCVDHIERGAICKHAGAVLLWWHRQFQVAERAQLTNELNCEGADSSQFPHESVSAFCSRRRAGGRKGAVDTGLGAASSSCDPNGASLSAAASCTVATVEPDGAPRRALEFGTPRNSKPRSSSVPACEVIFPEAVSPEPKSALKVSWSPAGQLAAERRVRVVVADEVERSKSAVPVGSGSANTG